MLCCKVAGTNDGPCNEERRDCTGDKWIEDSAASFYMTRSADLLSDIRLCDDKGRVGDNHLIDVLWYDTLTVASAGDLNVKLLDVACVQDITFNLFSLMAARTAGIRFTTEKEDS